MANEARGNPFETNVLVKYEKAQKTHKSYFIHELPPNCSIDHLRERIQQVGVPFGPWELVYRQNTKKPNKKRNIILSNKKSFDDYGIKCWDCIYVLPRSECQEEMGGQRLLARFGGNLVSSLGIWSKQRGDAGSNKVTLKPREKSKVNCEIPGSDGVSGRTRSSTLREQTPYLSGYN
ncbi:hypothetical protein LPJ56_005572, partial [Coemansia sp. RSA 2599]